MRTRASARCSPSFHRVQVALDEYVDFVTTTIAFENYRFDLEDLYGRMWEIAVDDGVVGTRLFKPRPGGREALKWLIEDLSGATADLRRTTRANNALRQQAHRALVSTGWADRINQVSFRLLRLPEDLARTDPEDRRLFMSDTTSRTDVDGVPISDVPAHDVSTERDTLRLADLDWSPWHPLDLAATEATTSPGVYTARSDGQIVYIGMAGERRGLGVRGRLQVYGRGRGAVSGLGEAALDRALADPAWLADRLAMLLNGGPSRSKEWAVAALQRAEIELCWVAAPDGATAREWETRALQELEDVALWNRARPSVRNHT